MKDHIEHTKLKFRLQFKKQRHLIAFNFHFDFGRDESLLVVAVLTTIELLRLIH